MSRVPLSSDQIQALSPDAASTKAARGLVAPAKWPLLGASDHAVWGECQGSGSKPYQTQVDVSGAGPTFRCSCPSRKSPCKHGLALLFLQAQDEKIFTAPVPAWTSEWLASRKDRAEKKEAKADAVTLVNPAASAKREAQRVKRVTAGAQELALWLEDTSRKGLATLSESDDEGWRTMAARMVDAQAPGLGQRLTQAMAVVGQGSDWPSRLLARLGKLQLLVDAVAHPERLTSALQADMQQAIGWPLERDEVLASGERVSDQWQVVAQVRVESDARLTERRVWLQGINTQRSALLIDFSFGGKPFEPGWITGVQQTCTLAFYPGTAPLRALLADINPSDESAALTSVVPPVRDSLSEWTSLAANPWGSLWPLWLGDAQLQHTSESHTPWQLQFDNRAWPLSIVDADAWLLMAFSGGNSMAVFGEWTGEALRPLTAWNTAGQWTATTATGDRQ